MNNKSIYIVCKCDAFNYDIIKNTIGAFTFNELVNYLNKNKSQLLDDIDEIARKIESLNFDNVPLLISCSDNLGCTIVIYKVRFFE